MIQNIRSLFALPFAVLGLFLSSCHHEDPGPLQEDRRDFSVIDFDRLEMGSAFNIIVEQGNSYSVTVKGDRRNINDLDVYKSGNTLIIEFEDNANRRHDTYITITMPTLKSINFSGASDSRIRGFESDDELNVFLSGASVLQLDADFREIDAIVSGASTLRLHGHGDELTANISGASNLQAFDYAVREASIDISGASEGKITATDELRVSAAGASSVLYRGDPAVSSTTSGASSVSKD